MENGRTPNSLYSQYSKRLTNALSALHRRGFEEMADTIIEAYKEGHQMFVVGSGGSGATASHLVCDINKFACSAKTIGLTGSKRGSLAKLVQISIKVLEDDMQIVEDIHLILTHIVAQLIHKK